MTTAIIDLAAEEAKTRAHEKHLKGEDTLVLSCGDSSIVLHKDGTLELKGRRLLLDGNTVSLRGEIHLN